MLDRVVVSRTCLGSLAVCVGVGLSADPEIVPAGVAVVGLITSDCSLGAVVVVVIVLFLTWTCDQPVPGSSLTFKGFLWPPVSLFVFVVS